MFAITTADLRIAHANAALVRFFGRPAEGSSLLDHVDGGSAVREELRRRLDGDGAVASFRLRGDGGRVAEATGTVLRDGDSRFVLVESRARSSGEWNAAGVLVGDMLDRISDGVYALDRAWRFVYVNRAASSAMALPREAILGRVIWEAFPLTKGSSFELPYRRVRETGEPESFEAESPTYKRWARVSVYPSGDNLVVYWQDITEERRIRGELEASRAQGHALFENANAGMALARADGTILAVNPEACRILRRTEADILAAGRTGLLDPEDPRAAPAEIGKEPRRGLIFLRRGDGTRVEVEFASSWFTDAAGERMTSIVFVDNTERRSGQRATEILARAGALAETLDLRRTIESLVDLVVPTIAEVAGVEIALEDGRVERAGTMPAPGEQVVVEVPIATPTRRYGSLRVGAPATRAPFEAGDVMLLRTLAQRAALAVENDLKHAEALAARRLRDEVLAVVAHDLRAPLNSALLATRVLEEQRGRSDEIAVIARAIRRSDHLIQDLLLAARLESGSLPLARADAGVADVVREALEVHARQAEELGVELRSSVDPPDLRARVDRSRVVQLLSNLVDNALRFTRSGGHVEVLASEAASGLDLVVRDDGEGIGEEELAHVFDRYWQGARERRAGAGLGLAIAKGVAEAHGGRIAVTSRPPFGTCFTIHLPVRS